MGINFEQALLKAKYFLEHYSQEPHFEQYARGYFLTSEFISRYLDEVTFPKGKALTVLSSGDHVFNLASHGITEIDAFDVNELDYFTFWLKYAFLLNISFASFKRLPRIISRDSYLPIFEAFLDQSLGDMPDEVYHYFLDLIHYQYTLERSNGLRGLYLPPDFTFSSNSYLKSEADYLRVREALKKLKIQFHFQDIRTLPKTLKDSYALILLSNISDYLGTQEKPLTYEEFRDYIQSFVPFLMEDGSIINYLYGLNFSHVICNSTITLNDLGRTHVRRLTLFSGEGYYIKRNKGVEL